MPAELDDIINKLDDLERRLEKMENSLRRRRFYRYLGLMVIFVYVAGLSFYFYQIYSFSI